MKEIFEIDVRGNEGFAIEEIPVFSKHIESVRKMAETKKKQVVQIFPNGETILFSSIREANRKTNINGISACCLGKSLSAGKSSWMFKSVFDNVQKEVLNDFNKIRQVNMENYINYKEIK